MRSRPGFSIIELIVAVGILGTAILLIVGIFLTLFHSSQKSVDKTAGFAIAQSLLAQETYQLIGTPSQATAFFQAAYGAPTVINAGNYSVNNASYFYRIYAQDVSLNSGAGPYTLNCSLTDVGAAGTRLKRLDLALWWWDANAPNANSTATLTMSQNGEAGYGFLQVHLSQLLWPTGSY